MNKNGKITEKQIKEFWTLLETGDIEDIKEAALAILLGAKKPNASIHLDIIEGKIKTKQQFQHCMTNFYLANNYAIC